MTGRIFIKHLFNPCRVIVFPMLLLSLSSFSQNSENTPIYKDHTQSFEARVDDLLSRMTLEEKISQMSSRISQDLHRHGIKGYEWSGQNTHCIKAKKGEGVA
ncbi:MAG: hypothetical protein KAQ79_22695, partial [Cyclobacteriaceae bacterium]|nr:hypothetical protein [Cyclobacteriaceae bacterium]